MRKLIFLFGIFTLPGLTLGADQNEVEALRKELRELRERTEQLERKLQTIEATPQLPSAAATNMVATPVPTTPASPTSEQGGSAEPVKPWSPTDPIQIGSARTYLNISLDGLAAAGSSTEPDVESLQLGGHDPNQRGFTLQNLELTLDGKVDPYLRAQANIVMQIDAEGETTLEAEEAYMETMALPANLQLKAGQFLSEFGRLNPTHPHTWDFVDQPLVNARFLGGEGLRNPGARLSWLMPTPFYSELFLAVQNSQGETAASFRDEHEGDPFFGRPEMAGHVQDIGDMLFVPRYAASFDLTDTQTILAGTSAAFGPNGTGAEADTQIYGVDLFWKWKPVNHHAGFPFVTWQTEAMLRRFEAGEFAGDADIPALPRERLTDWGIYSQVAYGIRKGWVAAFRGDYVAPKDRSEYEQILGPDLDRASRWRLSPNLTYYPSEFSKVRLQYNFDRRNQVGDDHSVWLQFEFLLGSHAAHKF